MRYGSVCSGIEAAIVTDLQNTKLAKRMIQDASISHRAITRATNVPESTVRHWRKRANIVRPCKAQRSYCVPSVVEDIRDLPAGVFRVLYADPPWAYSNSVTRSSATKQYSTQTVAEICAMPFPAACTDNAFCFLWATVTLIREAFEVLDAWGFTYKSQFVWCKDGKPGMGNYVRVSHELLLIGVRGIPPAPPPSARTRSYARCRRGRHSEKPASVRRMIERMCPGPYLEAYGRRSVVGWCVYGNEVSE
jgi:N6-adenosine-specific RNA methylase IME4